MGQKNITGYYTVEYVRSYFENTFLIKYNLKDLFGCSNGSLESLINSTGLSTEFLSDKKEMEPYKTNMGLALIKHTPSFVKYAMNDVFVLILILEKKIESYNSILIDVYKIKDPSYHFNLRNFPLTVGALVYKIF